MNSLPEWYRVLRHWKNKGRTGLSFSFLVGAMRNPVGAPFVSQEEAKAQSLVLYDKIKSERPEGCEGFIEDCGYAGGLMVKVGGPQGYSFPSFESLWKEYGEAISKGHFSLTKGVSHPMADCEIEWVQEALRS